MKIRPLFLPLSLWFSTAVLHTACHHGMSKPTFTLQLLHVSDMDGGRTTALENVERFSALVNHFRARMIAQTLFVSAGDNYIPGPIYQASADPSMNALLGQAGVARGEIALLNFMGLQATAIGNHELDGGPTTFAGIINASEGWNGARFPWLSANLDFSTETALASAIVADGQEATSVPGRLASSAIVTVNGEAIGLVGAVTPDLASLTSSGNITVNPISGDIDALAAAIQKVVDGLTGQGIDKIILLSHMQQIAVEKALAVRLNDVDIIVAGGSNTLLADTGDVLYPGDTAADDYPLVFASPKNEPVLLVNTDGDYKYLGRLVVDFDPNGRVILETLDPNENGVWASLENVVAAIGGTPIEKVVGVANALRAVLVQKDGNVAGYTKVFLEGRHDFVRSEETNLGNLSADANLWYAQKADDTVVLSLKNGGSIRAAIGHAVIPPGSTDPSRTELLPPQQNAFKDTGAVSQLDIETALAFNAPLSLVTVTAAELWDIMEHAVADAHPGATPGSFPQVGGLRFSFDPTLTARTGNDENQGVSTTGQRIRDLVVDTGASTEMVVAAGTFVAPPDRTFRMVTLQFLVSCVPVMQNAPSETCGDGYPFKRLTNPIRLDLTQDIDDLNLPNLMDFAMSGTQQDALAEYLRAFHPQWENAFSTAETPKANDTRIVSLSVQGESD